MFSRRAASLILALFLILAPELHARAEEEKKEADALFIEQLDTEMFGNEAVVVRDEHLNPVSVNGYPVREVRAGLNIRSTSHAHQFTTEFVDYPFWQSATVYDGNLATMSMALALSANRALNLEETNEAAFDPSENLERFLHDAGFEDIRKDDYSKETSMYTVATAIGSKQMTHEGEEPFTLLAVGVCGAYYKNEWQSNMSPGEGELHEGFAYAAQLAVDRLSGYILTHGIGGRVKVWISGFSRAAAVSNLVAGNLVRYGMLPKEDVYAYTFATPSAVLNPPETGYENIFNIISPMDLVPQVMPADWGYGRYGINLYLPVIEFSSLVGSISTSVRSAVEKSYGVTTNYSAALNLRMRLATSMILELIDSREAYNAQFQPAVVGLMQNKNIPNALTTLRKLLLTMNGSDREDKQNLDVLLDYLVRVFSQALTRTGLASANNNSGGTGLRLLNEHREDTYLASTDSFRFSNFEPSEDFTYVAVRGPVEVTLSAEELPELWMKVTASGETVYSEEVRGFMELASGEDGMQSDEPYYMERLGSVTVLAVPHDVDYRVVWEAAGDGKVEVLQADCNVRAMKSYPGYYSGPREVKAGDKGCAYLQKYGERDLTGLTAKHFGGVDIARFIGFTSVGINWRILLMLTGALAGLMFAGLMGLLVHRKRKGKKYGILTWTVLGVFSAAVIETEMAFWFFADRVWIRALWKAVIMFALLFLYIRYHRPKNSWFHSLFPGFVMAVLADIAIGYAFVPGVVLFLIGHVLMIFSFLHRAPMPKGKWIQWATVSLVVFAFVVTRFVPSYGVRAWAAAIYAPVLFLMAYSASRQRNRIRYAGRMFVVSDALLGVFHALFNDPFIHIVYMLLFYIALLLFALGDEETSKPALSEEVM